jgi:hypothetical protein
MKAVQPIIELNMVGRIAQHTMGRKKGGNDGILRPNTRIKNLCRTHILDFAENEVAHYLIKMKNN